ncbi:MAG: DUF2752 domain-containing protein [Deltaproteobacteria bacterium]|nr:DUF2752 domain-containing protein [Deltaproteobacteria bacterium]
MTDCQSPSHTRSTVSVRRGALALVGLDLLAAYALWAGWLTAGYGTCPSRWVMGVPCATCGMTRAFEALIHWDFRYALRANLVSPLVFVFAIGIVFAHLTALLRGRPVFATQWRIQTRRRVATAALVAAMVVGLASNLARHSRGEGPLNLPPRASVTAHEQSPAS